MDIISLKRWLYPKIDYLFNDKQYCPTVEYFLYFILFMDFLARVTGTPRWHMNSARFHAHEWATQTVNNEQIILLFKNFYSRNVQVQYWKGRGKKWATVLTPSENIS